MAEVIAVSPGCLNVFFPLSRFHCLHERFELSLGLRLLGAAGDVVVLPLPDRGHAVILVHDADDLRLVGGVDRGHGDVADSAEFAWGKRNVWLLNS